VPQALAHVARFDDGIAIVLAEALGVMQAVAQGALARQGIAAVRLPNGAPSSVGAGNREEQRQRRERSEHWEPPL
jgi:hypothetical protein